ncbi:MAG TPA: GreA/GreB family elongation factor [Pseudonocardia sp.]|jgi:transcription elongation GreA/GreB family factor|nr:GreA/GreB family elongation factor [Pseudonocardia sp.]
MNKRPGDIPGPAELTAHALQGLHDERTALHAQREQLRGEAAQDSNAADAGDRAEAMRRADDAFRLDDRIREIDRLLTITTETSAAHDGGEILAEGSLVRLRFPDGHEEAFYVSSTLDAVPEGSDLETLGPNSPLARELAGRRVGDTIRWNTPTGIHEAQLAQLRAAELQR